MKYVFTIHILFLVARKLNRIRFFFSIVIRRDHLHDPDALLRFYTDQTLQFHFLFRLLIFFTASLQSYSNNRQV